jgi:hypothetical protein
MSSLGTVPAPSVSMHFFLLAQAFSLLLDLILLGRRTNIDKDAEILLLRQQLRILQRKHPGFVAAACAGTMASTDRRKDRA